LYVLASKIQEVGLASMDLKFRLMGLFFDKVMQLNSRSVLTWNNKDVVLLKLGRHEEAIQAYDMAIQLNSKYRAIESTGKPRIPY